jgi:hypothetical protein
MNSILKKSITKILIVMSLASCQDVIQVDMDQKKGTIAVDAFLDNLKQTQTIRLTYTNGYFNGNTPPTLTGASVSVTDVTSNTTYAFVDNNDGNYTFDVSKTDAIIHTDHVYQLNVKYHAYTYTAITSCKRSAKIDSLYFEYQEADGNLGNNKKSGNILFINALDPIGPIPDFYWIKIYKNGKFYSRPENIQVEYFGYKNEFDGYFFTANRWSTSGPDGPIDPCVTGDKVRLEIYGISCETYDFLKLGKQMSNNGGLFATTPVNLPTNILQLDESAPKPVGIFSVSEVAFKELVSP